MAAKDLYHNAVRNGLEKEGWTITHDPLEIDFGDVAMKIDLVWALGIGHWALGKWLWKKPKSI